MKTSRLLFFRDGLFLLQVSSSPLFGSLPADYHQDAQPWYREDHQLPETLEAYNYRKSLSKRASIARARGVVRNIGLLNSWEAFVTLTIDPKKLNHDDPKAVLPVFQNMLKNWVKRYGLQYLLVAELSPRNHHIHFHGFMSHFGRLGKRISLSCNPNNGRIVYSSTGFPIWNLDFYNYGWSTCCFLDDDPFKAVSYIQKYITKENQSIFGHYYWSSQNIERVPLVYEFTSDVSDYHFDSWTTSNIYGDVFVNQVFLKDGIPICAG